MSAIASPTASVTTGSAASEATSLPVHHQIIVIGGGAAGLTTAAQLLKRDRSLDVAILEPSEKHYYQPGWTLVGGGEWKIADTVRAEKDYIPEGATWIQDAVVKLDPDQNRVVTRTGLQLEYDYLVVCPGIQIDWHLIKGLPEALGHDGVTSNYSVAHAPYTWKVIQNFQGGNAIFTYPNTPIKCGGAPQKIMYMADDTFKSKSGVGTHTKVIYCSAMTTMFTVPVYSAVLDEVVKERGIEVRFRHTLKEIQADTKTAVFEQVTDNGVETVSLHYDMIHVAPPMSAPDFIKTSPLAVPNSPGGWVDVDQYTLQHRRYPNVFSLGDASSLPISKTAAAIRQQAPVVVANLLAVMRAAAADKQYGGYTCCPLITGYNKTVMAEFDYTNQPTPNFPHNPAKERWTMWLVKKHLLPWLYWNRMIKGDRFEGELLPSFKSR